MIQKLPLDQQCKVTSIKWGAPGGWLPTGVLGGKAANVLAATVRLRDAFQRDEEIDAIEWNGIATEIRTATDPYEQGEIARLERVKVMCEHYAESDYKELESPDPLVKMFLGHTDGDSRAGLKATCVFDAEPEVCAAFDIALTSREALSGTTGADILAVDLHKLTTYR